MSSHNFTGVSHVSYWQQASVLDRNYCGIIGGLESVIYQPADVTFQIHTGNDVTVRYAPGNTQRTNRFSSE
jgi:hypothetical protein